MDLLIWLVWVNIPMWIFLLDWNYCTLFRVGHVAACVALGMLYVWWMAARRKVELEESFKRELCLMKHAWLERDFELSESHAVEACRLRDELWGR